MTDEPGDGVAAEPRSQRASCRACAGTGEVRRVQRNVFGRYVMVAPCDACEGEGTVIEPPDETGEPAAGEDAADAGEIEQLRRESEQRLDGWRRAQADYENLKRRSAQDVRDRVDAAQRAIFADLINLADDFERALADGPGADGETDSWRRGVALIQQKLLASLERHGVSPIAAAGVPFDPDYHEAMGTAPGPEGEVAVELRRGYLINSRVLRASQVLIGTGGPGADAADGNEAGRPADDAADIEEDAQWDE